MHIKDETTTMRKFSELKKGDVFKIEGGWWYVRMASIQDSEGRVYNTVCLDNGQNAMLNDDDTIIAVASEMVIR